MALLPLLFDYDYNRPSRILDQDFGHGLSLEDLISPMHIGRHQHQHHHPSGYLRRYYRPWKSSAGNSDLGSTIEVDKDKFQVNLDVQQFAPNEISVKVTGENVITIEGKHEEKEDEHGFISRQFVRRYVLPKGHNIDKLESRLSSDGVLTITAPKYGEKELEHRHIPITETGKPSRAEVKKDEEKSDK